MAATSGWGRSDSKRAVTAIEAAQICTCDRGCGKTAALAVTTQWQSELGLEVASAIAMASAIHQQQWRHELDLERDGCNSGSAKFLT